MLNQLRPYIKKYTDKIVKKINVNPNLITISSAIIAIIAAYCFFKEQLILGALLILFSGFLDLIDGAIARYYKKSSKFGAVLDSTTDRFSDGVIIIGLISGGYITWFIGFLVILVSYLISYVKSRAESLGANCNVGLMERAERLILITLGILIQGIFNIDVLNIFMYLLILLGSITVMHRLYQSRIELKQ